MLVTVVIKKAVEHRIIEIFCITKMLCIVWIFLCLLIALRFNEVTPLYRF